MNSNENREEQTNLDHGMVHKVPQRDGQGTVDAEEKGEVHRSPDQAEGIVYSGGPLGGHSEVYDETEEYPDGDARLERLYAGFWMRFWAYLLDLIVIGSIQRLIVYPVFRALDISLIEEGIFSAISVSTAIVFYLYFVLMTKFYGQTIGKMVFGLKVVELDGGRLSWGTVLFREWIGRFISSTIFILYVVVAFTKKKQGLHDLFADTTVIIEPR